MLLFAQYNWKLFDFTGFHCEKRNSQLCESWYFIGCVDNHYRESLSSIISQHSELWIQYSTSSCQLTSSESHWSSPSSNCSPGIQIFAKPLQLPTVSPWPDGALSSHSRSLSNAILLCFHEEKMAKYMNQQKSSNAENSLPKNGFKKSLDLVLYEGTTNVFLNFLTR